ncbi:GntR family transcriptional regulator [Novosphingobium mangrovi (ex Hu et al. 2023)]|uniref:GntR family transcriptional regulator n=1 Tax=Novosphingobium mangrovi (ex Hu et al. 2023) TaxID=2930094 RepID=A0ABT0A9Q2_9SPHN|nr:GntR family transcriptional regulator [Novosphingobium mangrovi (ex Hu et al. 2023)]MCJ1959920.1 GntR family transcriptional regulator [Novosphingobium mangrovi (ex Hu et al. 2023)]
MLDREGAVPLYHQIYLFLRDEILSGQRPFGSAMPTEQELAETYDVSRITARRVLNDLAEQNYVERKRRVGTRVIFKSPSKPIEANIDQAYGSLLAMGEGSEIKVLTVEKVPAPARAAASLQVDPGTPVVRIVRVRAVDGVNIGFIVSYVPEDLEPYVTREGLEKAPILKLLEPVGVHLRHAEQIINAVLAFGEMLDAMGVELNSPILRITRVSYDADDRPFMLTYAHYRADRFHIRMDLNGPGTQ